MAKMILVIEDETAIQNVIRAFLEDAGYTVVLASDGLEGIRQFRAHSKFKRKHNSRKEERVKRNF